MYASFILHTRSFSKIRFPLTLYRYTTFMTILRDVNSGIGIYKKLEGKRRRRYTRNAKVLEETWEIPVRIFKFRAMLEIERAGPWRSGEKEGRENFFSQPSFAEAYKILYLRTCDATLCDAARGKRKGKKEEWAKCFTRCAGPYVSPWDVPWGSLNGTRS